MTSSEDSSTEYSNIRISGPLGNGIQLTKEQAACVNYKSEKTQLTVKGAAGSGKSLVLMAKAKSYMRNYAPNKKNNIVVFSHTNSLTNYAKEYLDPDGSKSDFITIVTLDSYVSDIYEHLKGLNLPNFPKGRPTYDHEVFKQTILDVLKERSYYSDHRFYRRINQAGIDKLLNVLYDEIEYISSSGISTHEMDRYLKMERKGRGRTGIKQEDREEVFEIYKDFESLLIKKRRIHWNLIYIFIDEHKNLIPDSFKFDHVMVDEAQDLPITLMHIAIALMKQDVLIAMDANQRIYKNHWTMSDLGIPTTSRHLKKSFRCTKQIDDFAECLRVHNETSLETDDLSRHVSPEIEGSLPIVIKFDNNEQEYNYLIDIIKTFQRNSEIRTAIIVRINDEIHKWCEILSDNLIPHVVITGKRNEFKQSFRVGALTSFSEAGILSPGVKICTIHSAKGLEFHNVIIPHFNDRKYPPSYLDRFIEEESTEDLTTLYRNLSYVAMTRARANLVVSFVKYPSEYLDEIDEDLFEFYDCSNDNSSTVRELKTALIYGVDSESQRDYSQDGVTENFGPDSSNVLTESQAKILSTEDLLDYNRGRYEYHVARAERGYSSSAYIVATLLEQGCGVEKDIESALRWYFKAASNEEDPSKEAQYRLGMAFLNGVPDCLPPNIEEAKGWLESASRLRYVPAMKELIKCYDGTYDKGNKEEMFSILSMLGDMGDRDAIATLIDYYSKTDAGSYLHWLQKLADQGDVSSCYMLGILLKEGTVVPEDPIMSVDYTSAAADAGHILAQCEMALNFFEGYGVDQDYESGMSWLNEPLEENNAKAYCILGRSQYMDWGGVIDYDLAEENIRQSIKLGFEDASQYLDELHSIQEEREFAEVLYGDGLFFEDESFPLSNPERAKQLFESAAKRGSDIAKINLAKLKLGGTSDSFQDIISSDNPEDLDRVNDANILLRSAASKGNSVACYLLCKLFDIGIFTDDAISVDRYIRYLQIASDDDIIDSRVLYSKWAVIHNYESMDKKRAFAYAEQYSHDYPEALYILSQCYLKGVGTYVNPAMAYNLLLNAKENGYPVDLQEIDQLSSIAKEYEVTNKQYGSNFNFDAGSAPMKDPESYFNLFLQSANMGQPGAQVNLAICYYRGIGTDADIHEAKKWVLKSAISGYPEANYAIYCLLKDDVYFDALERKDPAYYLELAADAGSPEAMNILGEELEYSSDPETREKAVQYYHKAATLGNPYAYFNLGYCYDLGKGVKQDKKLAYKYYLKASEKLDLPKVQRGIDRVKEDLKKIGVDVDEL